MSKYKAGDKVLVEGEIKRIDYCEYPYEVLIAGLERIHFSEDELRDATKTYSDGLNDAWGLARKIGGMTRQAWYEIFKIEDAYFVDILDDNTYQQALAKIEAYEKSQQIQVGDVVYECDEEDYGYGVITDLCDDECCILWDEGYCGKCEIEKLVKTGRHIDIEHLLEQIRGDQ